MSKAKQLPLPREKLITRDEIIKLTGCNQSNILYAVLKKRFPKPVHTGAHKEFFYIRAEIMEWLSENNLKSCGRVLKKTRKVEKIAPFDNALATLFITGKINDKAVNERHYPMLRA